MDRKLAIKHELWRRNLIQYKFHSIQKELWDLYINSPEGSTLVWLLSRQTGKSYCLGLFAVLQAQSKPNSIIKLLTDTKLHARTIFEPIFREIFEDCPEDLKPEYIASSSVYVFANGSQIQLAGSDGGHCERLRGQKSDLILVDEGGFCDNLDYNINSILFPTTTHTGGRIVIASTPSPEPDHEFNQFVEQAEAKGLLTKKTLYDNPLLTPEKIENIISKFKGGTSNSQFRREYMCEMIKDENLSVLPEVDDELLSKIVKNIDLPPFYSRYVSMDIGFKDLTVVLFGYYDFRANQIVIQDEIVKSGKDIHLPDFTKHLQDKEKDLWNNPLTNELIKPDVRASDINPFVIQEISIYARKNDPMHPIDFSTATKHDKLAHINKLRVMLANEKIIINPKCTTLARHLKHCRWKDKSAKDDFARSIGDDGHYDAVDALLYFVRAINFNKNPYPSTYGFNTRDLHIQNPSNTEQLDPKQVYASIFGARPKRR